MSNHRRRTNDYRPPHPVPVGAPFRSFSYSNSSSSPSSSSSDSDANEMRNHHLQQTPHGGVQGLDTSLPTRARHRPSQSSHPEGEAAESPRIFALFNWSGSQQDLPSKPAARAAARAEQVPERAEQARQRELAARVAAEAAAEGALERIRNRQRAQRTRRRAKRDHDARWRGESEGEAGDDEDSGYGRRASRDGKGGGQVTRRRRSPPPGDDCGKGEEDSFHGAAEVPSFSQEIGKSAEDSQDFLRNIATAAEDGLRDDTFEIARNRVSTSEDDDDHVASTTGRGSGRMDATSGDSIDGGVLGAGESVGGTPVAALSPVVPSGPDLDDIRVETPLQGGNQGEGRVPRPLSPRSLSSSSIFRNSVVAPVGSDPVSNTTEGVTTPSDLASRMSSPGGWTTFQNGFSPCEMDDGTAAFLRDPAAQGMAQNFAMEHRIFLRAILQLLTERDQFAIEADPNNPHTLKTGPLKKASHLMRGIWKVKYVEVRRGLFSYYEDAMKGDADKGDELQRKSVPLRAGACTCRAVKVQHKTLTISPGGAIFELTVEGGPRRLWMANSREERLAWIHAIHDAMIGGSVTQGGSYDDMFSSQRRRKKSGRRVPSRSPYRADLEQYIRVQGEIKSATSKEEYVQAISGLVGDSLDVPVKWIKHQVEVSSSENDQKAFLEEDVSMGIVQLWKDLLRDSVSINGEVFIGDSAHGPERIIGSLTRCIMNLDRSSPENMDSSGTSRRHYRITEAQALSYARDILLACNRTRSGGDSYYCVDTLCSNSELVVLCPSSMEAEPLAVAVRHASQDQESMRKSLALSAPEKSGWIMIRGRSQSKTQKPWQKRFCVLSEGVLSYYEKALPRPHGLRGQLNLAGASMSVSQIERLDRTPEGGTGTDAQGSKEDASMPKRYIVCLVTKDRSKERQLRFDDEVEFSLWRGAFRKAIGPGKRKGTQSISTAEHGDTVSEHRTSKSEKAKDVSLLLVRKTASVTAGMFRRRPNFEPLEDIDRDAIALQEQISQRISSTLQHGNGDVSVQGERNDDARETAKEVTTPVEDPPPRRKSKRLRGHNSESRAKGRGRSTVEVSVQASTSYKICTTDPQGIDAEDTWALLRADFLQNFRLSGGPNGRILRGEEIVELNFLEESVTSEALDRFDNASVKSENDTPVYAADDDLEVQIVKSTSM